MIDPTIDAVSGADPDLALALAAAGLPTDDLALPGRAFFRFAENGVPIGFIGWETAGDRDVLLRSLVVLPDRRGAGAGTAMIGWALTRLAELGFTDAWMLTTTIVPLARRLGFVPAERDAAPAALRTSRQFASLCPATALLLHRSLP